MDEKGGRDRRRKKMDGDKEEDDKEGNKDE